MSNHNVKVGSIPTLENDMYGVFLAKSRGAKTIAFGTHITPIPQETLRPFPALDFGFIGEPDITLRDLLDNLENRIGERPPNILNLFEKHDPNYEPGRAADGTLDMRKIKGLTWRENGEIVLNMPRPFVADLDDMPIPMHELLPLDKYRMPMMKGPFTFIVPSRGCTAGCTYCIKHVSYQYSVRLRSPKLIMEELWKLKKLGLNYIHMYADLFTVNRDQVMELCQLMIDEEININWMSNSRVDYVDESEVLTPADVSHHINKHDFKIPFVCGCRNLGEALRRIGEGAAMIRTKGEAGTGDVVEAVRHARTVLGDIRRLQIMPDEELMTYAKNIGAPYDLVKETKELGRMPVVNFAAGGIATPADAALMMQLGVDGVFVGSGIFKSGDPAQRADAIVKAVTHFNDPHILAEVSKDLGEPMVGRQVTDIPEGELIAGRGW